MRRKSTLVGGARNKAPKPGTDLVGITTPEQMLAEMNFYSIVGHGAIEPRDKGTVFLVPERTFIMFTARAGEPTDKIKPIVDAILNDFRYKKVDPSTGSLETDAIWTKRVFDSMNDGTLFQDLLYSTDSGVDNSKRIAIYQPGDLIQDLVVVLENESPPWDPVGLWKLPMEPSTEEYLQAVRGGFNKVIEEAYVSTMKESVDSLETYINNMKSEQAAALFDAGSVQSEVDASNEMYDKIITYILYNHRVSSETLLQFNNEHIPDAIQILLDKDKYFKILYSTYKNKMLELSQERMIDQTAFDTQPKNLLLLKPQIRDRQTSVRDIVMNLLPNFQSPNGIKPATPVYNFFIFDICRSLMETPYPAVKGLVRTLSNVSRYANTSNLVATDSFPKFNTLLRLTKTQFQRLADVSPAAKLNPILAALLRGESITYKNLEQLFGNTEMWEGAFEDFVKYHRFDTGDKALVIIDETVAAPPSASIKALDGKEVIIDSVVAVSGAGGNAIYYNVFEESEPGKKLNVFNRFLWKNLEEFTQAIEAREERATKKVEINAAIATMQAEQAQRKKNIADFNSAILHFTAYGKPVRDFKFGSVVKIFGLTGRPHFNDLIGVVVGNEVKKVKGEDRLLYKVRIISKGTYENKEDMFLDTNLILVSGGGSRRYKQSRKSYRKRRRQTKRRASKH